MAIRDLLLDLGKQLLAPRLDASLDTAPRPDAFLGGSGQTPPRPEANPGGGWYNALTGMGLASHDKAASTGFASPREVTEQEATDLYRGDGLATRVVDLPVQESLRQGWTASWEGDDKADIQGWAEALEVGPNRRGLDAALAQLLTWAQIYGGAALYLDCAGPASEPVNEARPQLVGLRVLSRWDLESFDLLAHSPFAPGTAPLWRVRGTSLTIHPSRLLLVGRSTLPPSQSAQTQGWGDSVYTRIWQSLAACGTLDAQAVNIVHNYVTPVQKMNGLADRLAKGGQAVFARLGLQQLIRSAFRITVLDGENESFEYQTTSIAGLPELLDRFPERVAAVTGIPLTLLQGRSPGGLNATGESDTRFFYDSVAARYQTGILRPVLRRVLSLALRSPLGPTKGKDPGAFEIRFHPLYQLSELEQEQVHLTRAQRDQIYVAAGVLSPEDVAQARFGSTSGDVTITTPPPKRDPKPAP